MINSIEHIVTQLCDEMPPEHELGRTKHLASQLHEEVRRAIPGTLMTIGTRTKFGSLALAPRDALATIKEYRTRPFMRGMLKAVEEARRRFPGEKIRILYAGTGPAAPLVLPILMRYTPDEVQVDAIDIHKRSIDALKCFNDINGTQNYYSSYRTGDAITYRHVGEPPHIIVSETMAAGLLVEPQAYITRNLAPQLIPDGIFVPEGIDITLSQFLPPLHHSVIRIGDMHTFNASDFMKPPLNPQDTMSVHSRSRLASTAKSCVGIQLDTRVRCFGGEEVLPMQSLITHPHRFQIDVPNGATIAGIDVSYVLGSEQVQLALLDEAGEVRSREKMEV